MTRHRFTSAIKATFIASLLLILMAASTIGASAASWSGTIHISDAYPESMTIDDTGKVHVSLRSDNGFRYVTNRSGSWQTHKVTGNSADLSSSIALSAGKVYIAFARTGGPGSRGIYLATNKSGSWKTTRLTTDAADYPSLRMRGSAAYIAYKNLHGLRFLTDRSGDWVRTSLFTCSANEFGSAPSLALDAGGSVHIAYARFCGESTSGLSYVTNESGHWVTTRVTSNRDQPSRIVIDSHDRPVIGYSRDGSPMRERKATLIGGSWTHVALPGTGGAAFTIDSQDRVQLLRHHGNNIVWSAQRAGQWLSASWHVHDASPVAVRTFGNTSFILYTHLYGGGAYLRIRS